jgi:hypothetical protein
MVTPNSKCVVLVPVAKTVEFETEQALTILMDRGYPVRTMRGGSQIDLVRSILVSKALQDGFNETFWIDSDVVFDPNDVDKLRAHDLPNVCGLYVKKGTNQFACTFKAGTGAMQFGTAGGLNEITYSGMGFNYIRREVYDGVQKAGNLPECLGSYDPCHKIIPYFMPGIYEERGELRYFSEDFSFCRRAKDAGFRVMADTSIKLGHVHRYVRTWDDLPDRLSYASMNVGFED